MKTCKDCIHYDVCPQESYATDLNPYMDFSSRNDVDESCYDFKDKTKFIELPCPLGTTVYMIVSAHDSYDGTEYKTVIQAPFTFDKLKSFNRTIFLTEEDAERKLRGNDIRLESKEKAVELIDTYMAGKNSIELSPDDAEEILLKLNTIFGEESKYLKPLLKRVGFNITEPIYKKSLVSIVGNRILYKGDNPLPDVPKKIRPMKKSRSKQKKFKKLFNKDKI